MNTYSHFSRTGQPLMVWQTPITRDDQQAVALPSTTPGQVAAYRWALELGWRGRYKQAWRAIAPHAELLTDDKIATKCGTKEALDAAAALCRLARTLKEQGETRKALKTFRMAFAVTGDSDRRIAWEIALIEASMRFLKSAFQVVRPFILAGLHDERYMPYYR